jgi:hypothetical protein
MKGRGISNAQFSIMGHEHIERRIKSIPLLEGTRPRPYSCNLPEYRFFRLLNFGIFC